MNAPFDYVGPHIVEVEEFIQPQPGGQVQASIRKRPQAEHAPETDQVGLVQDSPQGRDGESDQKKPQRPVASGMRDELDRIRTQVVPQSPDQKCNCGKGGEGKDCGLRPTALQELSHQF